MQPKWLPDTDSLSERLPNTDSVSKRLPDSELLIRYRRFMYEFEKQRNVQVGLKLFIASIGAAVLALVLFVWSFAFADSFYYWVQFAYALSMLAVPLAMLSLVVLLQPYRETLRIAVAGVAITTFATLGFLWVYPYDWYFHGDNYTLHVVAVYAIGMVAITYTVGRSLKAHAPQLIQALTRIRPPETYDAADSSGSAGSGSSAAGRSGSSGSSDADGQTRVVVGQSSGSGGDGPTEVTLVINGGRYSFGDGETFGRREEPWLDDLMTACGGHEEIPYVSSEHLAFTVKDDGIYVTDLSRNGTKLNGEDIAGGEAKLSDGDTFLLADRAEIGVEL